MAEERIIVRNITEDFVEMYLDGCMEGQDMCTCPKCRADVLALSLNRLAPHYVVSVAGEAMVRHSAQTTQGMADIVSAIAGAVKIVKSNPDHAEYVDQK